MLLSLFLLTCLLSHFALASSHSEAPSTAVAAGADITDFYMFRSYGPEAGDAVTFIINSSPLQSPFAGPNYYGFSPTHFYQLHISSGCVDEHVFSFYFGSSLGGDDGQITEYDYNGCTHDYDQVPVFGVPTGLAIDVLNFDGSVNTSTAIPLKAIGGYSLGQTDLTGQNYFEVMHVDYSTTMRGDRDVLASNLRVPYPNVGDKTFPGDSYNAYLEENDGFVHQFSLAPFCVGQTANVFAGQRADSFSVNLGRIFDLLNFNPIPGFSSSVVDSDVNNLLRDKNVQTIAIEIPRTCLTGLDTNHVVTAWATVSELYHNASDAHLVGAQFSRLGNPLVNEVAIGLPDKQLFSISPPTGDGAFLQYVNYPSLPAIINAVYLPFVQEHVSAALTNIAPTNLPRLDLQLIFLFGFPNLNQPATGGGCEAMRLNVEVPPVELAEQQNMGVLALDVAGYPNGRRPGDDVVDISLRAMMGVVCSKCEAFGAALGINACAALSCGPENAPVGSVEFLDGAPQNAAQFMDVFPYLNPPYSGATANKVRGSRSSSAAAEMDSIF